MAKKTASKRAAKPAARKGLKGGNPKKKPLVSYHAFFRALDGLEKQLTRAKNAKPTVELFQDHLDFIETIKQTLTCQVDMTVPG